MNTDFTDFMRQFEASFGSGPDHPPIESRLRAGQRALLVRRAAAAAATLVLAAIVGIGLTLLGRGAEAPPVSPVPGPSMPTEPTTSAAQAEEQRLTEALVVDGSWRSTCDRDGQPGCEEIARSGAWVGVLPDGGLARIDDTIVVVKREDDPVAGAGRERIALEVRSTAPGRTTGVRWFVISIHDGTYDVSEWGHSGVDFPTFAANLWAGRAKVDGMPSRESVDKVIGRRSS